ncbi:Gfo/Idh/MocA family protein [Virgibacillus sp. MG-45]|uniref:Gfo/Idh/MocA family protein n=1 Tax=Virgibacillus sp. MG-45 TaxID=3102791 RepID=UPI002ED91198
METTHMYKIGLVGLGSIGTRHLHNIVSVLQERNHAFSIDLFRSGKGKELDEQIQRNITNVYYSSEQAANDYDVIFITNPTHLHFSTIAQYVPKTKHMFIEKPVFDQTDLSLEALSLKNDSIYYVACPLRYTDVIQYLKEWTEKEGQHIYSARVISSSYLPEWRPGVDYRTTYSAHKNQGGGVSIDLIHEWDYLHYLFGKPEQVFHIQGTFSHLEIDSDDLSLYIARYRNMAVEVHLDYFGREPIREVQLFTREDTIVGDLLQSEVRFLKSGKTVSFHESRNDFQRKEIEYFFDVIEGKKQNENDIVRAMETLKIVKEGKVT